MSNFNNFLNALSNLEKRSLNEHKIASLTNDELYNLAAKNVALKTSYKPNEYYIIRSARAKLNWLSIIRLYRWINKVIPVWKEHFYNPDLGKYMKNTSNLTRWRF